MANWFFWLIVMFLLIILECLTVSLVSIWFIASSIVALILSLFIENFFIQFLVFVILGVILLILTKPLLKKYLIKDKEKTNIDRVIGMTGIVTEDILKNEIGEVKVDGKRWSAISDNNILKGTYIIVKEIKGVKLFVIERDDL